jgi:hypothetical protein
VRRQLAAALGWSLGYLLLLVLLRAGDVVLAALSPAVAPFGGDE